MKNGLRWNLRYCFAIDDRDGVRTHGEYACLCLCVAGVMDDCRSSIVYRYNVMGLTTIRLQSNPFRKMNAVTMASDISWNRQYYRCTRTVVVSRMYVYSAYNWSVDCFHLICIWSHYENGNFLKLAKLPPSPSIVVAINILHSKWTAMSQADKVKHAREMEFFGSIRSFSPCNDAEWRDEIYFVGREWAALIIVSARRTSPHVQSFLEALLLVFASLLPCRRLRLPK